MDNLSTSAVTQVSATTPGSAQSAAAILALRKAIQIESAGALELIDSLPPQPARATRGTVGTRINTYA